MKHFGPGKVGGGHDMIEMHLMPFLCTDFVVLKKPQPLLFNYVLLLPENAQWELIGPNVKPWAAIMSCQLIFYFWPTLICLTILRLIVLFFVWT